MTTAAPLYWQIDASGMAYPKAFTTSDTLNIGKIAATGVGGVAMDAGGVLISNVQDPSSNQDAANKQWTLAQIQKYLTGLSWKTAVRAATTGALADAYTYANGTLGVGATLTRTGNGAFPTVDGVTLGQYDRVLIKDESGGNAPYNGIYTLSTVGDGSHPWQLTRATDNDEKAEMNAATVSTDDEGSANPDQAYIQNTYNPTMGSTAIVWVKGPGTVGSTYTASHGAKLSTNDIQVNAADGLTTDATYVSVNLGANPGLQLVGVSPNKTLSALPDTTRGLNKDGSGLYVYLNGASLVTGASGLSVAYAPAIEATRTASGAITAGGGVYYSGTNVVSLGDSSAIAKCAIVGVAMASIGGGSSGLIGYESAVVPSVLVAATPGNTYYMGHGGTPVLAASLVSGDRAIQLGVAVNATDLEVHIRDEGMVP